MAIDPTHFLRCVSDALTQVRDQDGRLLGAIPRCPPDTEWVNTEDGTPVPLRLAVAPCVCCDTRTTDPRIIPGFIPLDPAAIHLLTLPNPDEPEAQQ